MRLQVRVIFPRGCWGVFFYIFLLFGKWSTGSWWIFEFWGVIAATENKWAKHLNYFPVYEWCLFLNCRIENDRVENYTITQSFNKHENWTKALKYMLCDLKWALFWFVGNTNFQPLSPMVSSHSEVPAISSLYAKHAVDCKAEFKKPRNP